VGSFGYEFTVTRALIVAAGRSLAKFTKLPQKPSSRYNSTRCQDMRCTDDSHRIARLALPVLALALLSPVASFTRLSSGQVEQAADQAQIHADKSFELIQKGDLVGAEVELRQALELEPRNATYLGSLGAVLGMLHRLDESNVYLQRAIAANPNDLASLRNLASNQFQLGELEPARHNLEKLLKARPGDPGAVLLLGMVAEESKDYPRAIQLLASVPAEVRKRPESLVALARSYYGTGQKEKARETLQEFQSAAGRQDWQEGVFLGGKAASQAGDYETAEQMFSAISATYPDAAKLGYNLALAQYQAGHIERSQATLQKLLDAGYETGDIDNLMSWCLYKQGRVNDAVARMGRAIEREPGKESNYLDVGMMLIEQHRYPKAMAAAQKAVQVAPDSYQAWRLKGLAEAKLDLMGDAKTSYARAVELNPSDEQSILGLASEQLNDGKFQEAKTTLDKAIQRLPRNPGLYVAYGKVLLWLQGSPAESSEARAISMLKTALRLDSSLAEPHYQLGKLALRGGRAAEARQELEAAARLDPSSSKIHYELAMAYRKLARTADAVREMSAYRELKAKEAAPPAGQPMGGSAATLTEEKTSPETPRR